MRFLSAFLLCLLCSPVALSQAKPVVQLKGELDFGDQQERIVADKFLEGENKLLLVGRKTIRLLDVVNAKLLESRSIEIPDFTEDNQRVISPDGRRMLVFGNYDSRHKTDKVKRPPSIWDLQTGKQIAVLGKTAKPIRAALWSKNGQTLATSSDRYAPLFTDSSSVEVSFWDGETFAYKNSLPTNRAGWWHLTEDGDRCIYSTGEVKGTILLLDTKYVSSAGPVSVWNIADGKIEQTIATRDGNVERKIRGISLSPDERFLALVTQPPKSKDAERRLAVWEMGRGGAAYEVKAKYEIKADPKIDEYGAKFSPDGKYLTLNAGKNIQVYEAGTGEKRLELPNIDRDPSYWLADNRVLLFDYGNRLEAYEAATGGQLYRQKLISEWSTYTSDDGMQVNDPVDTTEIMPHPNGKMFLTYSNQYVKVFEARTGELLQTIISPPIDYSKKKPKVSDKRLVSKAAWSNDGKTLYVIGVDGRTVSLWGLLEN